MKGGGGVVSPWERHWEHVIGITGTKGTQGNKDPLDFGGCNKEPHPVCSWKAVKTPVLVELGLCEDPGL